MPTKLDRLYKYGRLSEHSEALFSMPQIFFAAPSQLNDPFECRPCFTFDATQEQTIDSAIRMLLRHPNFATGQAAAAEADRLWRDGRLTDQASWEAMARSLSRDAQSVGVYCLSRDPSSILMWSHYARNHEGYCLEFSATDSTPVFSAAQRVDYSDDCPTVNLITTPNEKQIDLIFLTKFTGWHYEQEWRIIDHNAGPGPRTYPPELLKGIVFGLRMKDEDRARIREWVRGRGHPVKFYQARQHERKFSIEIQEIAN